MIHYESIDVVVTLRCNWHCECLRLCNMPAAKGLRYDEYDLTMIEVRRIIDAFETAGAHFERVTITGGEPLLHPNVVRIVEAFDRANAARPFADTIEVNTNGSLPVPVGLQGRTVTWWPSPNERRANHRQVLGAHDTGMTYDRCKHFRKARLCVTRDGFSRCCAAEGYLRLHRARDLMLGHIPAPDRWPNMDRICNVCAFGE